VSDRAIFLELHYLVLRASSSPRQLRPGVCEPHANPLWMAVQFRAPPRAGRGPADTRENTLDRRAAADLLGGRFRMFGCSPSAYKLPPAND
jgi:hypothetical protein